MRGPFVATPVLAISFALMGSVGHPSAAGSADLAYEQVLAKSNSIAPPPYRAFRRMEGGLTSSERQGWLEAWTEYQAGRGFTFEVVREGGSEYVRNKILRGLLASEQKLIAGGRRLRASLEAKNYTFGDGGSTESGLQRIILIPAKKSDGIVNGSLLIEPASGLITTMQGRLVKNPSFWVRDVDVTWRFAHIGAHAVPIEMISTGRVRMFGRSNFRMVYQYVSVDGRPVSAALAPAEGPR